MNTDRNFQLVVVPPSLYDGGDLYSRAEDIPVVLETIYMALRVMDEFLEADAHPDPYVEIVCFREDEPLVVELVRKTARPYGGAHAYPLHIFLTFID